MEAFQAQPTCFCEAQISRGAVGERGKHLAARQDWNEEVKSPQVWRGQLSLFFLREKMEEGSRNSRYQARTKKAALRVESLELGAAREKDDPRNMGEDPILVAGLMEGIDGRVWGIFYRSLKISYINISLTESLITAVMI